VAGGLDVDRDAGLDAAERVLEGEAHLGLEVGAAPPCRLGSRPAPEAPAAAEEVAEEPTQVAEVEVARDVPASRVAAPTVGRAERVVLLALLGVREHVVGCLDLLEALLGGGVAGVAVGMVLAGELAVRLLDRVRGSVLRNAECGVQLLHYSSVFAAETTTLAGRSTRSPSR